MKAQTLSRVKACGVTSCDDTRGGPVIWSEAGPSLEQLQRELAHKKHTPPYDPTVALCLGPYGGPRGGTFSYERGTLLLSPVLSSSDRPCAEAVSVSLKCDLSLRESSLLTTCWSGSTDVVGGPASRHGSLNFYKVQSFPHVSVRQHH